VLRVCAIWGRNPCERDDRTETLRRACWRLTLSLLVVAFRERATENSRYSERKHTDGERAWGRRRLARAVWRGRGRRRGRPRNTDFLLAAVSVGFCLWL